MSEIGYYFILALLLAILPFLLLWVSKLVAAGAYLGWQAAKKSLKKENDYEEGD